MFEGCSDQIEIWINAIISLGDSEERTEIANWIVKIVKRALKRIETYVDLIHEAEQNNGEPVISAKRMEDIFAGKYFIKN